MQIILLLSVIFFGLSLFCSLYRQLQMLQQNSYFPSRYIKWIYSGFMMEITLLTFVYCLDSVILLSGKFVFALILSILLFVIRLFLAIKCYKKSIKKLVFTARIKRLIATCVIIFGALLSVCEIFEKSLVFEISLILISFISVISPVMVLVSWLITAPIEKSVSKYYINDAKKILKNSKNLTVIGITGSFGKTTTKFILNRILSEKFNTVCTPQSFNTPMGVVRTVREKIKPSTQMFICEMGAKNVGDIKEICDIAHPDFGIITSVGAQHLETFKSIDNVFKTKFELANEVRKNGGLTFISADSEDIVKRYDKNDNTLVLFGADENFRVENIKRNAYGSNFDLILENTKISVSTKLLGVHSIYDILAACSVAYKLGVDENSIKVAVASLKAYEHRLELKPFHNGSLLIDDAYNSNPVGCLEAVRVLGDFDGYKKTIVTPGLIELGEKEYEANYNLGLEAAKYCDIIILVGKNRSKPLSDAIATTDFNKDNLYIVSSFKEAMDIYIPLTNKNSVVLLENDLPDNYLN